MVKENLWNLEIDTSMQAQKTKFHQANITQENFIFPKA